MSNQSDLFMNWQTARDEFKAVVNSGSHAVYTSALELLVQAVALVAKTICLTHEAIDPISPAKSGMLSHG